MTRFWQFHSSSYLYYDLAYRGKKLKKMASYNSYLYPIQADVWLVCEAGGGGPRGAPPPPFISYYDTNLQHLIHIQKDFGLYFNNLQKNHKYPKKKCGLRKKNLVLLVIFYLFFCEFLKVRRRYITRAISWISEKATIFLDKDCRYVQMIDYRDV